MNDKTESSTSNGTPTASAQNQPSGAEPPPGSGKNTSKKRKVRKREVALSEKCDELLTQSGSYPHDRLVREDTSQVRLDRAAAGQVMASPGFDADRLAKLQKAASVLLSVLGVAVDHLCRALSLSANGKAFVAKARGGDTASTARNLIRDTSPDVLGHNQPLLDDVKTSLAEYEGVAGELAKERDRKKRAQVASKAVLDRLALSLGMLAESIGRAEKRAKRDAIAPPVAVKKNGKHAQLVKAA